MHVLALDTTTRAGSAALVVDAAVIEERRGDGARTHAERLPAELLHLLSARGLSIAEVDVFAVASGPGSFTGLRIGIATMQGLALTAGRPLVAVSALEALAHHGAASVPPGTIVAAWMDAHRHDVFAALYRRLADAGGETVLEEIEGPTVDRPAATLERWRDQLGLVPAFVVGDGATLYRPVVMAHAPAATVPDVPLLAGTLGRLAAERARQGEAIHPAAVQPLYVRRPDAEVARDQAKAASRATS